MAIRSKIRWLERQGWMAAAWLLLTLPATAATATTNLLDSLEGRISGSAAGNFTGENCVAVLKPWNEAADRFEPRSLMGNSATSESLRRVKEFQERLFALRLRLRDHLSKFSRDERYFCGDSIRHTLTSLRDLEEQAALWRVRHGGLPQAQGENPVPFDPAWTQTNPRYGKVEFKAGDIILEHGANFTSSLISRMANEANVFSHLVMVGQDKQGRLHAIEASGEFDVRSTPLEEWLAQRDSKTGSRLAVYRTDDPALGKRAGRYIYEDTAYRAAHGTTRKYNFNLVHKNYAEVYCTELAGLAYGHASQGKMHLPDVETSLTNFQCADILSVLDLMGIHARNWFAPSDIDVDPRFNLVGEYRDLSRVRNTRQEDAVVDAMMEWMLRKKYELKRDPLLYSVADFAVNLKKIVSFLPFSEKTPPALAETFVTSEKVGESIKARLAAAEDAYIRIHGSSMTRRQMARALEQIRSEDYRAYKEAQQEPLSDLAIDNTVFHWGFAPNESTRQLRR